MTQWLTAAHLQQTCRLLVSCAVAGGAANLLHLPEWYWALVTVVVVMQPDLSHTLAAGRDRVIATIIGALVGLLLIVLREQGLPTVPLFAAGLVPLAFLTAVAPGRRLACATLVIVFLIPGGDDPYGRPLFRVLNILLGAVACILVSLLVFPRRTAEEA
jgi:uncharacterized membrane protein YccC